MVRVHSTPTVFSTMKKLEEHRKFTKFKPFQIRWREHLGRPECPYLYRWSFVFFNFSIRIHHWIRSDVKTHFHDHPYDFLSIVIKGSYHNITPNARTKVSAGSVWISKGTELHYLEIPRGGAWTLLFCSRPYKKWGFFVNGKRVSPRHFFNIYGHPGCNVQ